MYTNAAALLTDAFGDLEVRPVPFPAARPGQLILRNRAIAVNPLDLIKQTTGNVMYRWLPYPAVLGEDVAGEVVEVGAGVTRFVAGDRVMAYALGMEKGRDHLAEGGFQLYTAVDAALAAPLPDSLAFEDAVVLPLAVSTAATALFQDDHLGLRPPTGPRVAGDPSGVEQSRADEARADPSWVVVWGGSTSVGSNALQLAAAAGYRVATTGSSHNHDRLRDLGADIVVDRSSASAVRDLAASLEGRHVAGILAVGTGSGEACVSLALLTGTGRVALTSPSVALESLPRARGAHLLRARILLQLAARTAILQVRARLHGVRAAFVWGSSLHHNAVGPMLWEQFLPAALAAGTYTPAPAPRILGEGLDHLQPALDALREGVSAVKLVVTLPGAPGDPA